MRGGGVQPSVKQSTATHPPLMSSPGLLSRSPPPRDVRSPPLPVSRTRFDAELLRAYVKKLLASTLQGAAWPPQKDRARVKAWMREIGERVKERMLGSSTLVAVHVCSRVLEIEPRGL